MTHTLGELAQLVGGELRGDGSLAISGAAIIDSSQSGDVTLADRADRARGLAACRATAVIASRSVEVGDKPAIVVDDVHAAFAKIVEVFRPRRTKLRRGVSPQAHVHPAARLADDVDVFDGAAIGEDVQIGSGTTIHSGVRLMAGCVVGKNVTLFPNVVLYENTRIGDRTIIHAGAVLGAYGFGYRQHEGQHVLSAQLGYVEVGADVEIGASTTIDRGTYGPTVIGEGTKIDNLVMIAHNCQLGRHNLICSQVGIAGSTTTGDYVVMAGQVGVRDHVRIGDRAIICSKSGISNDIPAGVEMLGAPAIPIREAKVQMAAVAKLPEMRREFKQMRRQLAELLGENLGGDAEQAA